MVPVKSRLVSLLWVAPLGPRPLEALKGLNDQKELRWWDSEPCLVEGVLPCLILGNSIVGTFGSAVTTSTTQIFVVTLTPLVLIVPTLLSLSPTVGSRLRCASEHSFGHNDYIVLNHGVLLAPLEQLINR